MASIPPSPKPNFQECYKLLQEQMEYVSKLNILDENSQEYKDTYAEYIKTINALITFSRNWLNMSCNNTNPKIKKCHDQLIDLKSYIEVIEACYSNNPKYQYYCEQVSESLERLIASPDKCPQNYAHIPMKPNVKSDEFIASEIQSHLQKLKKCSSEFGCVGYPNDFVVVPEIKKMGIICGHTACNKYPLLKSQSYCKEHTCTKDGCNSPSIIIRKKSRNFTETGMFCKIHECQYNNTGPYCIVCSKTVGHYDEYEYLPENLHYECACDVQTCANPKKNNGFCVKHKDFEC